MNSNKKLKQIEIKTFNMGNKAYDTYNKTKSLEALKNSVNAYRTTMLSIKYQLIFNNLKQ